jgi:hypothetical protein
VFFVIESKTGEYFKEVSVPSSSYYDPQAVWTADLDSAAVFRISLVGTELRTEPPIPSILSDKETRIRGVSVHLRT